ncbi:MAG: hypothetical protein U5L01_14655 [Rheinheimera sp.]|nr:hypothetical protein [Rheinheimera sp.]
MVDAVVPASILLEAAVKMALEGQNQIVQNRVKLPLMGQSLKSLPRLGVAVFCLAKH